MKGSRGQELARCTCDDCGTIKDVRAAHGRTPYGPGKRKATAGQRWPHDCAAERDAIPPDKLRTMLSEAIEGHLPVYELARLKQIKVVERKTLMQLIGAPQ
ncbi:hypothetical protein [Roseobacter sp. AzwK-3b]|uniref:hypothetical protein n=1 Tax=Roseobacter sp. AzwK-3b TaxID=351016 RepID=UPI0018DC200A|nr:hypothetical protein [Roseobacter sp. AzwK-3b]